MPDKKQPREENSTGCATFPHTCLTWMDLASTSLESVSETDSFADFDIRDEDPESAHSEVIEISGTSRGDAPPLMRTRPRP